ncbi:spore germination protein [Paenibacillus sp. FSL R7-0216]|uniref:spore germination protein n=1 Tax=Paenibacillus sp. FSL R7-0216 TaxID=2921677 RepID=UPI0030D9111F
MNKEIRFAHQVKKQLSDLEPIPETTLSSSLDQNAMTLSQIFASCADLVIRNFFIFDSKPCLAVYLDVLVDRKLLEHGLLSPLMDLDIKESESNEQVIDRMKYRLPSIVLPEIVNKLNDAVQRIVKGEVVIFIESMKQAMSFNINDELKRPLEEPSTEAVVRGPRIGFIEKLNVNMSLIRHNIHSPYLKMEKAVIGATTHTELAILYIEGIAPQSVIQEAKQRLNQIEMDSILSSGYIEELIRDHPKSPFPVIQASQRPDAVSAALIQGKVAILVDGTPFALILPVTFWFAFQTVEDYYINFLFASMLRMLRFLFAFLALALPSLFVAVTTYHSEMIPTALTLSLASAREIIPFPALLETFMMEVTFEALREAGVRLPRPVGQTISIVGALVIGQAAVQAGIISAPLIIVVSLTGIASFLIPQTEMSQAISLLRFPLLICAGTFGLYGVSVGLIAILIHLTNLRSFGVSYLSPVSPFQLSGLSDVFVRAPWQQMKKRQKSMKQELE